MPRQTQSDTRRFRRWSARILVDYTCEGGIRCDYATSISAGGLFIETESTLPLGRVVKLRFRLPDHDTLHEIEGQVCWRCDELPDEVQQVPGFGIQFTDGDATTLLARQLEDMDLVREE